MPEDRRIDCYQYKDFDETGELQKEYLGTVWLKQGNVQLGPGTEWNLGRILRDEKGEQVSIASGERFFNALKGWSNGYIGFEEALVDAPIPEKVSIE